MRADRQRLRAREHTVSRVRAAGSCELCVRFALDLRAFLGCSDATASCPSSASIEARRPRSSRLGVAADPARRCAREVEFAGHAIDQRVTLGAESSGRQRAREPQNDPLEMCRQRRARLRRSVGLVRVPVTIRRPERQADRAAPLVERVEDVGLAEFDAHRPARADPCGSSARSSDRCRDTRPSTECRRAAQRETSSNDGPDDADQVSVVLPTEVGFDFAAVVVGSQSQPSTAVSI